MPERSKTHYFGAGPAPLPTSVLEDATKALLNYENLGIGVAEMSHRSPQAAAILEDVKASLYSLLAIPQDDYEILFLQGGGSGQFSAVVYHMVALWVEEVRQECERRWGHEVSSGGGTTFEGEKIAQLKAIVKRYLRCDYIVTGSWSLKASQEAARLVGAEHVHITLDAREHNGGKFGRIPDEGAWKLQPRRSSMADGMSPATGGYVPRQPAFTYYCDNETVDGVEFPALPAAFQDKDKDRRVVADMSSNFLSRAIPISNYSVIFAGAQKNLSVAGITIVIVRKSQIAPHASLASPSLLRRLGLPVGPVVLDFSTAAKNNSLYNTLPIFDVWIAGQVLRQLKEEHGDKGISGQEAVAGEKARLLYEALDRFPAVYNVVPEKGARSRMNVCLRIGGGDTEKEKRFLAGAEAKGLTGLKGHRSVGGIRISNYNAVSLDAVQILARYLDEFPKDSAS